MRITLILFAMLLLCGCGKHLTSEQKKELWIQESNNAIDRLKDLAQSNRDARATAELMSEITNSVIGLRSIITAVVSTPDDNISNWTGFAQVEYINHLGGVDRTNLSFFFKEVRPFAGLTDAVPVCYLK